MNTLNLFVRKITLYSLIIFFLLFGASASLIAQSTISLAGQWEVKLDRGNVGVEQKWYNDKFSKKIMLPGSIQEHGYGDSLTVKTDWVASSYEKFYKLEKYAPYRTEDIFKFPFWLTSDTNYRGVVWYKREVTIPENWKQKRIILELERAHWGTMVFVDNKRIGADSSLTTPHRYDLSSQLTPGRHTISIRVDNNLLYQVGVNAHSVTDHTQTNWNGLIGDLSLKAASKLHISNVQVYPDLEKKQAKVKIFLENKADIKASGSIRLQASSVNSNRKHTLPSKEKDFTITNSKEIEMTYSMGDNPLLWDEFNPQFYTLNVSINDSKGDEAIDIHKVDFGMRNFEVNGTQFSINDKPIFLRGTLMSAIFPITGYPSTSKKEWAHHFAVMKQHGLNHARFHSWCPPEAAFEAADEAGIYLQVEGPLWANQGSSVGDGKPVDQFLIDESKRIMKEYGNHPSFVLFAHGNEPAGDNKNEFLGEFVSMWEKKDKRHVYTSAAGWPVIPENEYHNIPAPRIQQWGEGIKSVLNGEPPSTDWDFRGDLEKFDKPVIGHENGQWTVYPNFNEMSKYTGVMYPHNFEIFQDFLQQNNMLHQAHDFFMASGELQAICYKAEIEAALRTPGYAGYQMLDLHDFPGQGTALVGILDPFWDSKPYISPSEFSQFSSPTVPLAVMEKRILSKNETFTAKLEIAHFTENESENVPVKWKITNGKQHVIASGKNITDLPIANKINAGIVKADLSSVGAPQKLNLSISVGNLGENNWDFWVYPEKVDISVPSELIITKRLSPEIEQQLKDGATVLLKLDGKLDEDSGKKIQGGFSTPFWNTSWTGGQAPQTMGVLVNPTDPLFKSFPTEYHTNWQWWDIVHDVHPMILSEFPADLTPSIQMIDTWFEARKLGILFEAKVGDGKLMVTSIDFDKNIENRLPARQLYKSILDYINSDDFDPNISIDTEMVRDLYK